VTLKSGLEVTSGQWIWCHSKAWVLFAIRNGRTGRIIVSISCVSMLTRDKNENRSTFDKVIEHQWAYFGGTQCTCSWCCYYLNVSLSIDVTQSVVGGVWYNERCPSWWRHKPSRCRSWFPMIVVKDR